MHVCVRDIQRPINKGYKLGAFFIRGLRHSYEDFTEEIPCSLDRQLFQPCQFMCYVYALLLDNEHPWPVKKQT